MQIIEYLKTLGIKDTHHKYTNFFIQFEYSLKRLYDLEQGQYDYKSAEMYYKIMKRRTIFFDRDIKAIIPPELNHLSSIAVKKLIAKQLLNNQIDEVSYLLNFSQAAEAGMMTAKKEFDLDRIDTYVENTVNYKPFLYLATSHDPEEFNEVMKFKKTKIKVTSQ